MRLRLGIVGGALALWVLLHARGIPAGLALAAPAPQDPDEPLNGKPSPKLIPPPGSPITSGDVDQKELTDIINELVACGTRSSLSSWKDTDHEIGCGRNRIVARFQAISKAMGGELQVKVDRFEATAPRTANKPVPLENVIAILPGTDPTLSKTVFLVSGHFDSMPSDVMDSTSAAPGADDDASGVAVSIECARLVSSWRPPSGYRATVIFAAVSGEEQGLLGSKHLVEYLRDSGYTVGGMLDDDIVGADFAPGAPHRVRVFSAGGPDGIDSPSRELARMVEDIDSRDAVRLIFRDDRLGRGGDHMPFIEAGDPAVRFTEPLEDYHHEHQTPRIENGVQYGDLPQYLNFEFLANVVRDNAEVLRELAMAPAPPADVTLSGGVTPSAVVGWQAPSDTERGGFEILWRETTSPRWSVYDFVFQPGETALTGVSTDNRFFAVRSVGKNGARSLAVPAVPKRRTRPAAPPASIHGAGAQSNEGPNSRHNR
ncbi:MAG TPA: M28 family peptidase [Terriglobia bacterium]|nr:M28 family peptidase [Terriglobia bacterium]